MPPVSRLLPSLVGLCCYTTITPLAWAYVPRVGLRWGSGGRGRRALSTMSANKASNSGLKTVGFLGLGYMGNGMVRRLLNEAACNVVVWNRSKEKSDKLKTEFAEGRVVIADSPKAVMEAVPITFSMLSTPAAAREVFYATDGVLAGIRPGVGLVDCATLEVKDMLEFGKAVTDKGGRFLENPVSGSKVPAEQTVVVRILVRQRYERLITDASGQLVFLAGGDKGLFDEVEPMLAAMGKASFYLGDLGKGTEMKLVVNMVGPHKRVVNMVMGTMMASLSEGLVLAKKTGLDPKELVSVLGLGAMANPMFNLKGPKMIADDHAPNFPLKHAAKDVDFSIKLGEHVGVDLAVAKATRDMMSKAMSQEGIAELDFSATIKALE